MHALVACVSEVANPYKHLQRGDGTPHSPLWVSSRTWAVTCPRSLCQWRCWLRGGMSESPQSLTLSLAKETRVRRLQICNTQCTHQQRRGWVVTHPHPLTRSSHEPSEEGVWLPHHPVRSEGRGQDGPPTPSLLWWVATRDKGRGWPILIMTLLF